MLPELLHAHNNRNLEDLQFWLELAAQTGGPILELGCGTGRLLNPLAQAGYKCVGLDRDLRMLNFIQHNRDPHQRPVPSLVAADITRFRLAIRFKFIVLPCNTFSTLKTRERKECLGCVREHLLPISTFAVCVPNPALLNQLPARSAPEFEDEFISPQTGNPVLVSSSWQRTKHAFTVTWIYDQLFSDGTVKRVSAEVSHQLIPMEAYLDEFNSAGLRVKSVYGDFDRSTYEIDAPYLIILASP